LRPLPHPCSPYRSLILVFRQELLLSSRLRERRRLESFSSLLEQMRRSLPPYQVDNDRLNHLSCSRDRKESFLLFLFSELRRSRRLNLSSLAPKPRSIPPYQVDNDRFNHLSCSHHRKSTSYSSYLQDCVDGEGWDRPRRRQNRDRARYHPTKSTMTGSTTFPVLVIGRVLLTLPIFKVVSTEKGGPVLLRRLRRNRTHYHPTKSTMTGSTTFPVLIIGRVLLTLPIFKIVSTEKVGTVLLVVGTETTLTTTLPSRQ
jgi:hypothetical protein